MRLGAFVAVVVLASGSTGWSQRFGFTRQMIPSDTFGSTTAVALGDLDGDGDLDVFVGNGLGSGLSGLYLNDGTGIFTDVTTTSLPNLFESTKAIALGDVDGDGDLDAFLGNGSSGSGGGQNNLYLNGGSGTFTDVTVTNLPVVLDATAAVTLGDVDGDGDLDAFVGNAGFPGQQNRLYVNDGTGVFTDVTATKVPAVLDDTRAVALGDVDGDGDLDAFVGNGGGLTGQQNRLYLNGGGGAFSDATATHLPPLLDPTNAVVLDDVDGDGDLDAFLANGASGVSAQNRLYSNDGSGVFTDVTSTHLPVLLDASNAAALGDVDGDGDVDALVGNIYDASALLLNDGTGAFAGPMGLPATLGDDTRAVALGDVDGDGDLDAYLGSTWHDRLYLNSGAGSFLDVTMPGIPARITDGWAVALGDVDGDGDLDGFFANGLASFWQQDRLYLNDGTGNFSDVSATHLPFLLDTSRAVALGDVDGDGDLDAYVGNLGQDRLYRNGGTGVFTDFTVTNLPVVLDSTNAVALGDLDGDGDLDAFVGNGGFSGGAQNRLYLNGGTGVFVDATATNLPVLADPTFAVAVGDVDGDADVDVFVGNGGFSGGAQNRLYLNGGTGAFADATATNLPALVDPTLAVALGDVDGDGDLDAIVANFPSGGKRLYLNDGAGTFVDVSATNLPAVSAQTQTRRITLGDLDGDGDLDAFFAGSGPEELYVNDGTGIFSTSAPGDVPFVSDVTRGSALGDLDGDGDLDLVVANGGQNRVYTNLSRQLGWRGIPRLGKPLTLDMRGPANGPWILGVALGTANIPLGSFGTLRLDPTTLIVHSAGALDGQGRASVSFVVPASPVLLGIPVYWQAVVGSPFRFTNLEITSPTNL